MRLSYFSSKLALAVLLAGSVGLSACTSSGTSSSNAPNGKIAEEKVDEDRVLQIGRDRSHVTRSGEVYLMRGLLNVFSRGMDVMAGRMRAKGFDAISYNHADWMPYARDIVERSKRKQVSYPIIIMGHSLGGNEAPKMANYLAANGVNTALIVTFDPTETQTVGPGIDTVINYYLPNGRNVIQKARGFTGSLSNVDVSGIPEIEHVNVEKNTGLQNKSIERSMKLTKTIKVNQNVAKRR
jgi:hypothetical protein